MEADSKQETVATESKSPLSRIYSDAPPYSQRFMPYQGYGFRPYNGYSYRPRGNSRGGIRPPTAGNCFFCGSNSHFVRDCQKMKDAKNKLE